MPKISDLPAATTLVGNELIPIVQGGVTSHVAASALTGAAGPPGPAGSESFGWANIVTDYGASGAGVASPDDAAFLAFRDVARLDTERHWILIVPPGDYYFSTTPGLAPFDGIRWLTVYAYGANFTNGPTLGSRLGIPGSAGSSAAIAAPSIGDTSVTLITAAEYTRFTVDQWIYISALDLQGFGQPPNHHFFEFQQVGAINSITGVITLKDNSQIRQRGYKTTYPVFNTGSGGEPHAGGPARAYALNSSWDTNLTVYGARITSGGPLKTQGKYIELVDCVIDDDGAAPTVVKHQVYRNCDFLDRLEPDKAIEHILFKDCRIYGMDVQSSSIADMVIDGCMFIRGLAGTPRNCTIRNTDIPSIAIGPSAYGYMETCLIENSRIGSIQADNERSETMTNWTLTAGVLSRPIASGVPQILIPGNVMDYEKSGYPIKILDVRQNGTNIEVVTTISDPEVVPPFKNGARNAQAYQELPPRGLKVVNSTGCKEIVNLSMGTALGYQYRNYAKHVFTGNTHIGCFNVKGILQQITVNVIRAYTGTQGTLKVLLRDFAVKQSDNTGGFTDFYVINLKTAGKRIISITGNSGAQTGDTLLDISPLYWMVNEGAQGYSLSTAADGVGSSADISAEAPSKWPIVSVEIITNFGEAFTENFILNSVHIN